MAQKKKQRNSEEVEVPSSQHEEEEDEPSPVTQPHSKIRPTTFHSKPSSSESDSDSEPDSHPPIPAANPKVKPHASMTMEQIQKSKVQPSSNSGSKKSNDSSAAALDDEIEEDEKKSGKHSNKFQRLWSEEDEINILKGVADFTDKTGQDPVKYANSFLAFMKKTLHVNASSNQLKEKVRRMKKKFAINAGKGKNGEGPKFFKPHEQKTFELSKKLWGSEPSGAVEKAKSNGKATKSLKKEVSSRSTGSPKKSKSKPEAELASLDLKESGKMKIDQKPDSDATLLFSEGLNGLNQDDLKRGLELMEESKRAELEGKWKKLRLLEIDLFSKRALLVGEQTRLMLEALKSSEN